MNETVTTQAQHPTVAVLGAGIMGAPMARNIAQAGVPVRVWNRTRSKAEPLAHAGARIAATPQEAVAEADVIVTMLTDGTTVREVMADLAAPPGAIWAQTTTVGVDATADLAELADHLGLTFVDAPVLGTRAPAEQGALTILASGDPAARSRLAPVFDAIGARTRWLGPHPGAASRLKLVANSWVLALTSAAGEAVALAEALGVAPGDFLDLVAGGPLDTPYLHAKATAILEEDYTPSFSIENAAKDARLITEAARESGIQLDLAAASAARFERAVRAGHGQRDMAAGYYASFATESAGAPERPE
ncbi:NAD(P)-dependent oxidoreductase [Salinactinospora qingdaonensis]|uniref:NAD(P)-dependent oxidoreductase n=1 Tax=Salinactinospora qingdaonensis TaxID=702744 RepID=A0ABP7GC25_9ACTN